MTAAEDRAEVVKLACEVEDRDRTEKAALRRVARATDREINAQLSSNPHLRDQPYLICSYPLYDADGWKVPARLHGNKTGDGKTACPGCRGEGKARVPRGGWSLLERYVDETEQP